MFQTTWKYIHGSHGTYLRPPFAMARSLPKVHGRAKSTPSRSAVQTAQQPQIFRQRHAGNRPPGPINHGKKEEVPDRSPSPYASTFATLLEGPLLMPATASMFMEYPIRSPSLIKRLDKPLPALPREAVQQHPGPSSNSQESEESIADMYEAYRPMLITPSPLPSQQRRIPNAADTSSHSVNHDNRAPKRQLSWRPSILSKKGSARHRGFPTSHQFRSSAPVRPSPLRQSLNVSDSSYQSSEFTARARPLSTPVQPLLLHPPSPLNSPPRRKQPNCWKKFKLHLRKAFMTEEGFEEYHEEGWQMHDGFRQLHPDFRTGREGADRFGKMEFMVWSAKNQ